MPTTTQDLIQLAIDVFVSRRVRMPEILVAGKRVKRKALERLGITPPTAAAMPDLVIHEIERDWLFLMDVASPTKRMDESRRDELQALFTPSERHLILFSIFSDMDCFGLEAESIAWGTHVWIADEPQHMIHFNCEWFLEPYATISNQ